MVALYPDETFESLIGGGGGLFHETFETDSERNFANRNVAHVIHSHGDIPENHFNNINLRRRLAVLTPNS